ncbi:MAG: hypothetical protein ABSF50_22165 [Burkholderiaceae bacterium]
MNNKNMWARVAALVLSAAGGLLIAPPTHSDFLHPAPLTFGLEMVALPAVGIALILSFRSWQKSAEVGWERPSWSANPFEFMEPLVNLVAGAICIIASGLGWGLRGLLSGPNWGWEMPVAAGIGAWIGVRIFMKLNPDSLARSDCE